MYQSRGQGGTQPRTERDSGWTLRSGAASCRTTVAEAYKSCNEIGCSDLVVCAANTVCCYKRPVTGDTIPRKEMAQGSTELKTA